jgi:hypothetical protein
VGLIGDYGANRVPRIAENAAGVFEVQGVGPPELSPKMPPYDSIAIGVGAGELSRARPPHEIAPRVRRPR